MIPIGVNELVMQQAQTICTMVERMEKWQENWSHRTNLLRNLEAVKAKLEQEVKFLNEENSKLAEELWGLREFAKSVERENGAK